SSNACRRWGTTSITSTAVASATGSQWTTRSTARSFAKPAFGRIEPGSVTFIVMDERTNTSEAAATDFARRLIPIWRSALGDDLLGVYLMGSLAHGGFSARYSDVDLAVVTEAGISAPTLDRVRREAAALSADWAPKLSIFWADRRFDI